MENLIPMGKNPQSKKSAVCNPRSKAYNKNVAQRRAKEKNRRKAAKANRGKQNASTYRKANPRKDEVQ